jgi:hypothetical protein
MLAGRQLLQRGCRLGLAAAPLAEALDDPAGHSRIQQRVAARNQPDGLLVFFGFLLCAVLLIVLSAGVLVRSLKSRQT